MDVDSDAGDPLIPNGDGTASIAETSAVNTSSANISNGTKSANNTNDGCTVCEECEDRRSNWDCGGCGGAFCDVCFYALHRKGKRALHKPERIARSVAASGAENGAAAGGGGGGLLSGWIGSRLPPEAEVNPDMYDRQVGLWLVFSLQGQTKIVLFRYAELLQIRCFKFVCLDVFLLIMAAWPESQQMDSVSKYARTLVQLPVVFSVDINSFTC